MSRVTKSNGALFLTVYGKGGLFFSFTSLLRKFTLRVDYRIVVNILSLFLNHKKAVLYADLLCVPIRKQFHINEIVQWFLQLGYRKIMLESGGEHARKYYRKESNRLKGKLLEIVHKVRYGLGLLKIKGIKNTCR